jgi:hypothetical protein
MATAHPYPLAELENALRDVPTNGRDHVLEAVLEAAARAPLVPLTEHERALLAEVEGEPGPPIPHEAFMASLRPSDAEE